MSCERCERVKGILAQARVVTRQGKDWEFTRFSTRALIDNLQDVIDGEEDKSCETDIKTLRSADWEGVAEEVLLKIYMLKEIANSFELGDPLGEAIARDLILPAAKLLGKFCVMIQVEEKENADS